MWVQRDVDMRDYGTLRGRQPRVHASFDETCARWPSVCEVSVPLSATIPLVVTTPERSGSAPPLTPTPAVEVGRVHELSASYVPCRTALASAVATERAAQFRRDLAKFDAQVRRLQCSGTAERVSIPCYGLGSMITAAARELSMRLQRGVATELVHEPSCGWFHADTSMACTTPSAPP